MTCAVRHCPGLVTPPHIVCGRSLAVIARDRRELRENERLCREAAAMEREERERMRIKMTGGSGWIQLSSGIVSFQRDEIDGGLCLKFDGGYIHLNPSDAVQFGQTFIEWGKTGKLEASE